MEVIFFILILLFSVIIHEVAHGYAALWQGDPTAKLQNRLTLNPIPHIDVIGSIIVPTLMIMSTGIGFGWAKPVPVNPYNLKNPKWSEAIVAAAGPLSNITIAIVFGIITRIAVAMQMSGPIIDLSLIIVVINVVLAIFNLIPIPPLDGSKILFAILPPKYHHIRYTMERFGFVFVLVIVFFLWFLVAPVMGFFVEFLTGLSIPSI